MVNYSEVIKEVSNKAEISQKDAREVIDTLVSVITENLVNGDDVKIANLATFKVVDVAERTGIIQLGDRKGETYVTPAHKGVKVSVTKSLKEAVK